jgi:SAM-dependent MidA family methyltransferase
MLKTISPLETLIIEHISASPQQRITFADYMDLVLYHPQYGYYCSDTVKIGTQGDFFTSASLGSDFGELLAEQFLEMWKILGQPSPFRLIEVGAGQGLLANDILNCLSQKYPFFFEALDYIIIEKSSELIKQQQKNLQQWLDKNNNKIAWKKWQDIPENSLVGCCFSNELLDAFPVHRVMIENQKLKEVFVTYCDHKFQEVVDDISTNQLINYFELIGIDLLSGDYPNHYQTEVNLAALHWLKTLSAKLQRGYLLTIDYGYTAQRYYHPQRYQGTLQCYYQHRYHNNPYCNLGKQDITAHIDFTALEIQGETCNLHKLGFTQQGLFLMALGLGNRLAELSTGKFSFEQILKRRDALHQLINPMGLGKFGILIQAKGLTETEQQQPLKGLSCDPD